MRPASRTIAGIAPPPPGCPRMRIVRIRATAHQGWASPALLRDRWVAVPSGTSLHLLDLDAVEGDAVDLTTGAAPPGLVARIDDAACAAAHPDLLVVADRAGVLHRHDRAEGFRETAAWAVPPDFQEGDSVFPSALSLSASGRFLYAHLSKGAHLFDLATGRAQAIPCRSPAGHASFTRLPTGDEVLFVSAPSYMGIQMIDCASGRVRRRYEPTTNLDFCHVSYELSADGERLFTFGCVWAGPYAARIYDARRWTTDASDSEPPGPVAKSGLPGRPLPLPFEHEHEVGQLGDALPMRAALGRDGCATCVTLVALADVPEPGSEDDDDARDDRGEAELGVYEQLQAMKGEHAHAVVIRRVDPRTGRVAGTRVFAAATSNEGQVRVLPDHRVLAIGPDHAEILDGATGEIDRLRDGVAGTSGVSWVTGDDGSRVLVVHTKGAAIPLLISRS